MGLMALMDGMTRTTRASFFSIGSKVKFTVTVAPSFACLAPVKEVGGGGLRAAMAAAAAAAAAATQSAGIYLPSLCTTPPMRIRLYIAVGAARAF